VDFYEVYAEYHDRIRRLILAKVKNRWVADDLIQETFLRVLQNLPQVRDQEKLAAWIFKIAANLCQDHFRSSQRNLIPFAEDVSGEMAGEVSLEKQIEQYELSLWVQERLRLLPEPSRQVIFRCDIRQESYQEAADLLGISLENVKVRLHRARKQLKALLAENSQPKPAESCGKRKL
jgi:RNA polymerase sigma-70 factor, ECF subfamily